MENRGLSVVNIACNSLMDIVILFFFTLVLTLSSFLFPNLVTTWVTCNLDVVELMSLAKQPK